MKKLVVCAVSIGSLLAAVSAAQAGSAPPAQQQQQRAIPQKMPTPSKVISNDGHSLIGNAGGALIGQDGAGRSVKTGR